MNLASISYPTNSNLSKTSVDRVVNVMNINMPLDEED